MARSTKKTLQDHINRVRKWNTDAGHYSPEHWVDEWVGDPAARDLAVALVEEETQEMVEAVSELRNAVDRDEMNPDDKWVEVEIMDAAADIMFTLFGLLTKAGLADYLEPVFEEVCRSNETKLIEPVTLPNGKIGKNPLHFEEPKIRQILELG